MKRIFCLLLASACHNLYSQDIMRYSLKNQPLLPPQGTYIINGSNRPDTIYTDYPVTITVTKKEFKNKAVIDSIFDTRFNYLVPAIQAGTYNRIAITITTSSFFARMKMKAYRIDNLVQEYRKRFVSNSPM